MEAQGLKFCSECSNMLYPTEVAEEKKLAYVCKCCGHRDVVEGRDQNAYCVFSHDVSLSYEKFIQDPELSQDKTLSRTRTSHCPKCGYNEAVFFQNPASASGELGMSLVFVCCRKSPSGELCGYHWIQTPAKKQT